ncbi:MAG: NAD(+)/NADH kinase [Deltaproteobacteria bacterium]
MNSVAIVTKKFKPDALEAGRALQAWLRERGVKACHVENEPEPNIPSLPDDVEFIVVMGGDGTILSAARHYGGRGVPLFGVNLGGLGFLTEISLDELYPAMSEHVLTGKFEVEKRLLFTTTLIRQGQVVRQENVLNDAVINKGALARIAEMTTWIDGEYLTVYRADGLIVATPTGSTAYNLSAGGPIVYPTLNHLIILPICSHTLSNRPIILPDTVTVAVTLDEKAQDVYLTLDGQVGQTMEPGDRLEIRRAPNRLKLVKSPYHSHYEILRTKLGWGEFGVSK